jgi:NADH:ubiquinone oxidoreductase subunit 5 (subunit L)/multisubunit Na+/H+ antiporter MnhA subunit
MLVTADNFLQLFFGWEGVGLASYLLINFWFTSMDANKSAIKAMLVNRIGDFGLALGIMACFAIFQSIDYSVVFACASSYAKITDCIVFCNTEIHAINAVCILLFIGAVGKSAQIGLHTWLPDAMAAPTPVSALLHAATMVTRCVFNSKMFTFIRICTNCIGCNYVCRVYYIVCCSYYWHIAKRPQTSNCLFHR